MATVLFRVPDDSMKSFKVRRGDVLVVDPLLTPRDGQLVVAIIGGERVVRRVVVQDRKVLIKPLDGSDEFMMVGSSGTELVGVATAFIPIMEQHSSSYDSEVFMNDLNNSRPLRFAVLSVMNSYGRVAVGADGEIFTLGWKAVQELAAHHLIDQPVTAGTYRINDDQTLDIKTKLRVQTPFTITLWSEPLLGVLAVYGYREVERTWYFWAPESLRKN